MTMKDIKYRIIKTEDLKAVEKMSHAIDKLDFKLECFSKKYKISLEDALESYFSDKNK